MSTDEIRDPAAVPALRTLAPVELPASIGHAYKGRRLILHGLFLRRPLTVRQVEEALRHGDGRLQELAGQGRHHVRLVLDLDPGR